MAYQFMQGATMLAQQQQQNMFTQVANTVADLLCECGLIASKAQTKKPGPNCGRWFVTCGQPRESSVKCKFYHFLDDEGNPIEDKKKKTFGNWGGKRKADTQIYSAPKPNPQSATGQMYHQHASAQPQMGAYSTAHDLVPTSVPSAPPQTPIQPQNNPQMIQEDATRQLALELIKEKLIKRQEMIEQVLGRIEKAQSSMYELLLHIKENACLGTAPLPPPLRSPGHSQYSDDEFTQDENKAFLESQKAVTQKNAKH